MDKKILLIISNNSLRQLYHELLSSSHFEVMASGNIADSLLLLTMYQFCIMLIYVDDDTELKNFIRLRKRRRKWLQIPLIILTPEPDIYQYLITKKDLLFNSLHILPREVVDTIKKILL